MHSNYLVRFAFLTFVVVTATCVFTTNNLFAQFGPPSVIVANVEEREIREGLTFIGTVIPLRTSEVGSAVDGRVVEFPIVLGQRVKKDDVLAKLLTSQLDIEIAVAEAELISRKAAFDELKQSRPEEIERAKAQLAAKKSASEYTTAKLKRIQSTTDQRAYTQDQVEEIQSQAVQAYQMYLDAQQALEMAQRGAREELKIFTQAKVTAQEQEVARLKDLLAKHTIRAPFDGYIVNEYTEAGQWVAKGGTVAKVIELDQVDVEVAVLETYVPNLRLNAEASVEIAALGKKPFIGKIAEINPLGDQRTRNFTVRIRLQNTMSDNNQPLIKAGMFARATLSAGQSTKGLLVPKDAVVLGAGPMPLVHAVTPDPKDPKMSIVRTVPVQLGSAAGGFFEVKGELKANDQVVIQGNEQLRPGQSVSVVTAEKNISAAKK
jgi:HlyD family secretion protein